VPKLWQTVREWPRWARDFWRGATGADAYERYCAHLTARHPDTPHPSRATYFR
jgi:uncharacterized short protein YbdD (DUF466 family)